MLKWWRHPPLPLQGQAEQAALARQAQLTKPPGSLGRLEQLAVRLAAMQGQALPQAERVWISVFAADHGVAAAGVSAYPQAVTAQMVANFAHGGAAINVLARQLSAHLEVVDVGVAADLPDLPILVQARAGSGTADFSNGPAMGRDQLEAALAAGRAAGERARAAGMHVFIGGEMGIGNTTSASALACALLGRPAADLVGAGTGVDGAGLVRKRGVVERALVFHGDAATEPEAALCRLGGFEIAALCGAYIRCAQTGLPVLVDGFIAGVAALCAERLAPGTASWFLFAHRSKEPGHSAVLLALNAEPLLDLSMGLGEGSGAAVAVPLLRAACALHGCMATFSEAGVSSSP